MMKKILLFSSLAFMAFVSNAQVQANNELKTLINQSFTYFPKIKEAENGISTAQERLNIKADLVTYGKVIGGGMPVGAFGGKREIMEKIAPLGNVYQAGTLSGNPIAMIAGYTMLKELKEHPGIYKELEEKTIYVCNQSK